MILALLSSAATTGCLITDPVLPVDDSGNENPRFFTWSPSNQSTVFLANTTTPAVFSASATDDETPRVQIYYEWSIDSGGVVLEGLDETEYQTNGAVLGAGFHVVSVLATDDGLPTGFATFQWEVQVQ